MILESENCKVELTRDETFKVGSADNSFNYEHIYFEESDFNFPTKIGVHTYKNEELVSSAIIGSIGGGTGIHENSQIIEDDRIIVCCSDSIFCLSIPKLDLIWKTQADQASCFEIFKFEDSYIVHGELDITRINSKGEVLWSKSGADIFTTEGGEDDFEITESYIRATDWGNRIYKFDFNGNSIE
ncbi:MAG: hypothetical protein OCD76_25765 [Reichenbachiella sp.]